MAGIPEIRPGEAYALIAVPAGGVSADLPNFVELRSGLWVCKSLPVELPGHWQTWLGSIATRDVREAGLFLLAVETFSIDSTAAEARCYDEVKHLYWGLYLSGRFSTGGPSHRVSGRAGGEGDWVQTHQALDPLIEMPGFETEWLTTTRLKRAVALGTALRLLSTRNQPDKFHRFRRASLAFTSAGRTRDAADRIHEFVRVVEGFIRPDPGATERQFKSRTELFVGPSHHALMGELFAIRSAVEHLHGAFAAITGDTDRERAFHVLKRAAQAEALARHCITEFLDRPALWPHFADDDALSHFWKLARAEQVALWGPPLLIDRVESLFEPDLVPPDAL